ncbi:hypothetical protein N6H18_11215 [Reichenbachiella agarivorans]|uniref:Uncharacterized protein n=1 Tax=Reichenbachiella agarivorans TaxID=2979464 RepID=A0ABY6CK71_9BACT|nr:hypothetical protein [Reichenbachiella agarivorans]UXP30920.1 hypothetical protein N6H18_11215 [Reichenbachiella agarivorans]
MKILGRFSACIIALLFGSCHVNDLNFDKIKPIELSPQIAVKIGSKSYTIKEILEDLEDQKLEIHEDGDLLVTMVYREQSVFNKSGEIINVNTISNHAVFSLPTDVPALPTSQIIPFSTVLDFDFIAENGETIDSVFYAGGYLEYQMYSTFPAGLDYSWTVVGFRKMDTNMDLVQSQSIPYSGEQIEDFFLTELNEYKSVLRLEGDLNKLDVSVSGDLLLAAGEELTTNQSLNFDMVIGNPDFSSLFGYFGDDHVEIEVIEFSLDALSSIDSDGFFFAEPRFSLEVENSYGIEFSLDMSKTRAILSDSSVVELQETSSVQKLVAAPRIAGGVETTLIQLNASNSNVADIFSAIPSKIILPIRAEANPSISSLTSNFLTDSSYINVNAIIELPLVLRMNEFVTDFDLDFSENLDLDFADSIILIANIDNQMPFEGDISLELLNSKGELLSQIPGTLHFGAPPVGNDGRTKGIDSTESKLILGYDALEKMKLASKLRAKTKFSTYDKESNRNVKLFSDYVLDIQISAIAAITVEL